MWGQSEQQLKLEQRKAQIQKEIKEFQTLLNSEKQKEKSVLTQINEKNVKIQMSQKLISMTQKQEKLLKDDMYLNQLRINKLNRELDILKIDYSNMIVKSYKSRSQQSRIMFILSSDNFLQAYKRIQYMKQYASFRKIQGDDIHSKMDELETLNQKLVVQKDEKKKLLTESEKDKQALEKDRQEQEKLVKLIQKDKKKYAADIKKKQNESKEIDRKIAKTIKDAIAAANRKAAADAAAAAAKKRGASATEVKKAATKAAASVETEKYVLTKEGKIISDNFKANKGRLPWPVEKGYISLPFGEQPSPLEKSIMISNNGVEITTEGGSDARAIFAGEVSSIQIISGHKAVYIKHGDFITLYLHLSSVSVKAGDKVSIKQNIGTIATNRGSGKTVIKLFVFQNTKTLNPQSWLAPQ